MQIQQYGSNCFNVKREFESSRKKMIKTSIYLVGTGIVFLTTKNILELNIDMFKESIVNMLMGNNTESSSYLDKISSTPVVAFFVGLFALFSDFFAKLKLYITAYI